MAEPEFNETSETTILGFVVTYGLSKAITNGFAGGLGDKIGRKKLLILGMIVCLPVPIIILIAPNWWWVIIANLGLGSSQGMHQFSYNKTHAILILCVVRLYWVCNYCYDD